MIWLYYFVQPRSYRAMLAFTLSDSVGFPLPNDKQNNIVTLLLSQSITSENLNHYKFFSSDAYTGEVRENIRFSRHGDLINLSFKAETIEDARKGLEVWFSAFSEAIAKWNQKLLLVQKKNDQQYPHTTLSDIIQDFRSSFFTTAQHDAQQSELNALYTQLTDVAIKRIYLEILSSAIKAIRKNDHSLLSISYIANNASVSALKSKLDLLETQKAHMAVQLGWEHPQIKAMIAESKILSTQLKQKVEQISDQIHLDAIVIKNFELQLRKKINFFVKNQSQSLDQILNALENKIKTVIDVQNKATNPYIPLEQITKIHMVVPVTVSQIPFISLYGKNIFIGSLVSLIILFVGMIFFQKDSSVEKKKSRKEALKKQENIFSSDAIKTFETLITIEELSNILKEHTSVVISVIGLGAAQVAAKLSLHLVEGKKKILLVDISGQQIERVIGPHRGLSDILTGSAQLQDIIYRDYDTGVDILPQGLTSAARAQNFSSDIPNLLESFKKDYDFIILEMANKPQFGEVQIAHVTDYYICSVSLNENDWMMQMISKIPKTIYRIISH
ncbi:hypothetical protein [Bartonella sp. F02]|uniref:hypothetical protein n=1 Tax=Bartonella sp. F02 TaxID=2967262 RepID=UPI002E77DE42|nr:hypothetical protein [Bartonella sp. F02]